MRKIVFTLVGVLVLGASAQLGAQTALKGSRTTMRKQNAVAQNQDYTFLRTSSDVNRFVSKGLLVRVRPTSSLKLASVSFPYARPAVKLFAERIASQYHESCGRKLVITSLTRPLSRQPSNASDLSVHPAGMAMDIRVSDRRACRRWLEKTLVGLERKGVIDATRERRPAHYHVAVFPSKYESYVARLAGESAVKLASASAEEAATFEKASASEAADSAALAPQEAQQELKIAQADELSFASVMPLPSLAKTSKHRVRAGETLWSIARNHGVTVTALKKANHLNSSRIRQGQMLIVPRPTVAAGD